MNDNGGAQVWHDRDFWGPHWDQYVRMSVLGQGEVCEGRNKVPLAGMLVFYEHKETGKSKEYS